VIKFLVILVVALVVIPMLVPGALSGVPVALILAVLAIVFVPALRRLAIGLVVLTVVALAGLAYVSGQWEAARAEMTSAATSSPAWNTVNDWTGGLLAERWKPFVAGRTWKSTVGLAPPPCCIQPGDVQQGHLGDCWLLASLAAVARTNPGVIARGIQDNGDGSFTVTLYGDEKGRLVPRPVRVTPEFPEYRTTLLQRLMPTESRFAYAQPGDDAEEAWVMLFEKAAAAVKGGRYEGLDGGPGLEGLQMVTGVKAEFLEPRGMSADALAAKLAQIVGPNHAVTAGTFPANQVVESGPSPLLVGNTDDPKLSSGHLHYVTDFDAATRRVTIANQHDRNSTTTLSLQEFQFAFAGVFSTELPPETGSCPCQ
jgi:hypothetical protein